MDEQRWLNEYAGIVFKYQSAFGENGVNLLDGVKPPQALHVFVSYFQNIHFTAYVLHLV